MSCACFKAQNIWKNITLQIFVVERYIVSKYKNNIYVHIYIKIQMFAYALEVFK